MRILKYVCATFNTDSKKNYIFRDLIKQTYNMWDQTSVLETLKNQTNLKQKNKTSTSTWTTKHETKQTIKLNYIKSINMLN